MVTKKPVTFCTFAAVRPGLPTIDRRASHAEDGRRFLTEGGSGISIHPTVLAVSRVVPDPKDAADLRRLPD